MPVIKKDIDTLADWDLVVSFLHADGDHAGVIPTETEQAFRELGDGFGPRTTESELLFDWSHIRDSSDLAVGKMAALIRNWVEYQEG